MAERLDLAYAINVHVAQGVTTDRGIVALRSSERRLLTEKTFLVALIRVADKVALVLDDSQRVKRNVGCNAGEKTSALDVAGAIRLPDAPSPLDRALAVYAGLFLQAEREDGTSSSRAEVRALDDAATALDHVRPHAAEDLRIVLDRSADPLRDVEQGVSGALRQAWAEEGHTRADPGAYANRFVAD